MPCCPNERRRRRRVEQILGAEVDQRLRASRLPRLVRIATGCCVTRCSRLELELAALGARFEEAAGLGPDPLEEAGPRSGGDVAEGDR